MKNILPLEWIKRIVRLVFELLIINSIIIPIIMLLLEPISNLSVSKNNKDKLARCLVGLINKFRVENGDFVEYEMYDLWKNNGFFIIPNHFYQPIPDISSYNEKVFKQIFSLDGIKMQDKKQLELLQKEFKKYSNEYNKLPNTGNPDGYKYYFNNKAFDGVDALVYYCLIRHFKPKNIIEVGSGWSSKIAAEACLKNNKTKLTCIEPYPQGFMKNGFPGLYKLVAKKVEDVSIKLFSDLQSNDILFIDSSHTVKFGGDVNYLFLNILPKIKKGVLVHVHDIFIPYDYPKEWVVKEHRYWNEQYLFQTFLMFNNSFEVLYSNNYMGTKYLNEVKKTFPYSPSFSGGSFWIRRVQ